MSLHLTLLPISGTNESITSRNNFLNCERDNFLFDRIDQMTASTVPPDFKGFYSTEDCDYVYGSITKDGFDTELTFVLVKELVKLKPHTESQTNKAIWAYLRQLSPEGKIALYWH
jgi:hypothetical protein